MELRTIRQVSLEYGVSRRMLCYYEEIGLIKSSRKDDYAYRVYDESEIKRLQQIIILRKLQIPIKQISDILNNQDAVEVIEIFKQNIYELDEKITALSTVKSILARFIDELQEKVDVHLKLDLLNDTTMISLVDSLSIPISRIKEKVSMDELSRASEQLNKLTENNVRVVYHLPATVACLKYYNGDVSHVEGKAKKEAEGIMKAYIEDTNLFELKPDLKLFGFGDKNDYGVWEMWVTIPHNFDVIAPFEKKEFPGGLYAACTDHDFDLGNWVDNSNEYEWDQDRWIYDIEEYFNPFNIYGMKNIDSEKTKSIYTELIYPIKEIKRLTEEEKEKINTSLAKLNKTASCGNTVKIDLTSMIKRTDNNFNLHYENGLMIIYKGGANESGGMYTQENFNCPVKVELRAKTDKAYIHLTYANIFISLCWNSIPMYGNGAMLWVDDKYGEWVVYKKCGRIPINEFVDIELIISKEAMALKINGELRHYNVDYGYIKAFKDNPEHNLSGTVYVGTEGSSTVTVESLRVTEL